MFKSKKARFIELIKDSYPTGDELKEALSLADRVDLKAVFEELNGRSPFFRMIKQIRHRDASTALMRKMIDKGVNFDVRDEDQATPLHVAAARGRLDVVELMCEKGADLHTVNKEGRTPLMSALMKRQHITAAFLLKKGGADVVTVDNKNKSVLVYALLSNAPLPLISDICKKENLDINAAHIETGETALHVAACKNVYVQELLKMPDIAIDAVAEGIGTPLHVAVSCNEDSALPLLHAGAKIAGGATCPLIIAARNGSPKMMQDLLDAAVAQQVELDIPNAFVALAEMGCIEGVPILRDAGADVHQRDRNGRTLLMIAAERGHENFVKSMVSLGIDINAKDDAGMMVFDLIDGAINDGEPRFGSIYTFLSRAEKNDVARQVASSQKQGQPGAGVPMNPHSIIYDMGDGLSCTFNFLAHHIIYRDGASMCVKGFNEVTRTQAIEDAHAALKETFGDAVPSLHVPFVSVRKQVMPVPKEA
ncbi:MAG: ankyrin repeat domain-containing protein [Alphaproteobacteria bacterium]|nr:ankyrin repeat domain-containing protein [Alphaproteobacteria bacterium]